MYQILHRFRWEKGVLYGNSYGITNSGFTQDTIPNELQCSLGEAELVIAVKQSYC
mgnify:CR=1 FL=1